MIGVLKEYIEENSELSKKALHDIIEQEDGKGWIQRFTVYHVMIDYWGDEEDIKKRVFCTEAEAFIEGMSEYDFENCFVYCSMDLVRKAVKWRRS